MEKLFQTLDTQQSVVLVVENYSLLFVMQNINIDYNIIGTANTTLPHQQTLILMMF